MQKNYFLFFMMLLFCLPSIKAQESFEQGILSNGWHAVNVDNNYELIEVVETEESYRGNYCVNLHETKDYLISPLLHPTSEDFTLTAYKFSDMYVGYQANLKIMVSENSLNIDDFVLLTETTDQQDDWMEVTADLSAYVDKDIYVALVRGDGYGSNLFIDYIDVPTKLFSYDVGVSGVVIESYPTIDKKHTAQVNVYNNSTNVCSGYVIKMFDQNDELIVSHSYPLLATEGTRQDDFEFVLKEATTTGVYFVIEYADDENAANNKSGQNSVIVLDKNYEIQHTKIDVGKQMASSIFFSTTSKYSATQQVISNEMIDHGTISEIYLPYENLDAATTGHVKIWMYKTTSSKITAGTWTPVDEQTCVYEGDVTFEQNLGYLHLILNEEFEFDTDHLLITIMAENNSINSDVKYLTSYMENGVCAVTLNQDVPIDGNNVTPNSGASNYCLFDFVYNKSNSAQITGIVTDADGTVLKDVVVNIKETNQIAKTDTEGKYVFEDVKSSAEGITYSLQANAIGYESIVKTVETKKLNSFTVDFKLASVAKVTMQGTLSPYDENLNVVISNLVEEKVVTVDDKGAYSVILYDKTEYTLKVSLDHYQTYTWTFVTDGDLTKDVDLDEIPYNVHSVVATRSSDVIKVSWDDNVLGTLTKVVLDGQYDGANGGSMPNTIMNMGNLVERSDEGVITGATIFGANDVFAGNEDNEVTLRVYDLEGNILGESEEFQMPDDDWIDVELPLIPYNGDFYIMVHWEYTVNDSHNLGLATPVGNKDCAYFGADPKDLHKVSQGHPEMGEAAAMIRPKLNVFESGNLVEGDQDQFNIYRFIRDDIDNKDNWSLIATVDNDDKDEYFDAEWTSEGVGTRVYYAVSAMYGTEESNCVISNAHLIEELNPIILKIDDLAFGESIDFGDFEDEKESVLTIENISGADYAISALTISGISYAFKDEVTMPVTIAANETASFNILVNKTTDNNGTLVIKGHKDYSFDLYYTEPTGIFNPTTDVFEGTVYPNPFNDYFVVVDNSFVNARIELINLAGITQKTIVSYKSGQRVNTSDLSPGIYLLRISTDGKTFVQKIIKK